MFFFKRPVFLLFFMATFSSTILTRTVNTDGSPKESDIPHLVLRLAPTPQAPINPDDVVAQAIAETAEAERRIAADQEQTKADAAFAQKLEDYFRPEQKLKLDAEFALQEALAQHMLSKSDKKSATAEQKQPTALTNNHHVTSSDTKGFAVTDNSADEEEAFLAGRSDTPPAGASRRHSDAHAVATDEPTESITDEEAPGTVPTTPLSAAALAELITIKDGIVANQLVHSGNNVNIIGSEIMNALRKTINSPRKPAPSFQTACTIISQREAAIARLKLTLGERYFQERAIFNGHLLFIQYILTLGKMFTEQEKETLLLRAGNLLEAYLVEIAAENPPLFSIISLQAQLCAEKPAAVIIRTEGRTFLFQRKA